MKLIYSAIALALCVAAPASLSAQKHPTKLKPTHSVNVIGNDTVSGDKVYSIMSDVAPQSFNIPGAPRFALVGKNGKFYLGVGATLKGTLSYDFGNPMNNPNMFITSAITPAAPGNGGLVQLSAQQSSVFLNFVAMPHNPNQVGIYIQGNFLGNGYGFALQSAYAKWRGFSAGYNYSLFTDLAAAPPTIDYEGPNALTLVDNAVLNYEHTFPHKISVGIGAELPQASYTTNSSTASVTQRVPDIPAYVQLGWGSNSYVRFSGLLRTLAYRDLADSHNRNIVGWGVKVSGSAALTPALTAYYQGAYGRGMASYFQDLTGLGMDLMPKAGENGRLEAVKTWGAYAGLQYNFSQNVYASATYSHLRAYADQYAGGSTAWADQYKYAQYAVANVFWNVNSIVTVGAEYIWGRRVDMSGQQHHDNRLQCAVIVNI